MGGELGAVTKWTGMIASSLSIILGLVHLIKIGASVKWPHDGFIDDVQFWTWRIPMFTFVPDICVDVWTPFFLGCVGTAFHFKQFPFLELIGKSMAHFFFFMLILALFGNLGYNGGLGIICGAISLLACLFSLITFFVDDQSACLNLSIGISVRSKN